MQEYNIKLNMETAKKLSCSLYNYKSDIDLCQNRYIIDAKSVIGIFTLDLTEIIKLVFYGDDLIEQKQLEVMLNELGVLYESNSNK